MAIEAVREFFRAHQMEERILTFDMSSATVELAALALQTEPAHIAKTLSFTGPDGEGCVLIVAAGDAKIDNAKYKQQFGQKAKMLTPDEVLAQTGHAVGGVCPFGIPKTVYVYTDCSLKRFETIYPACGSGNSAIPLSCDELFRLSGSLGWINVCKGWQEACE